MTERQENRLMIAITLFLLAAVFLLFFWIRHDLREFNEHTRVQPSRFENLSLGQLDRLHHYHGINFSSQDPETGKWHFVRAGRRCWLVPTNRKG